MNSTYKRTYPEAQAVCVDQGTRAHFEQPGQNALRYLLVGMRDTFFVFFYQQLLKILLLARRWNY